MHLRQAEKPWRTASCSDVRQVAPEHPWRACQRLPAFGATKTTSGTGALAPGTGTGNPSVTVAVTSDPVTCDGSVTVAVTCDPVTCDPPLALEALGTGTGTGEGGPRSPGSAGRRGLGHHQAGTGQHDHHGIVARESNFLRSPERGHARAGLNQNGSGGGSGRRSCRCRRCACYCYVLCLVSLLLLLACQALVFRF